MGIVLHNDDAGQVQRTDDVSDEDTIGDLARRALSPGGLFHFGDG